MGKRIHGKRNDGLVGSDGCRVLTRRFAIPGGNWNHNPALGLIRDCRETLIKDKQNPMAGRTSHKHQHSCHWRVTRSAVSRRTYRCQTADTSTLVVCRERYIHYYYGATLTNQLNNCWWRIRSVASKACLRI